MKIKNYEKTELIIFVIIIFIILEVLGIIYIIKDKKYTYERINGIVSGNDLVTVIVDKKEKKYFYQNQMIYLNDKNTKYSIKEDKGKIIKKNKKNYYELLIKIKLPKNTKSTDILEFSIKRKKERIIKILKRVWEGG